MVVLQYHLTSKLGGLGFSGTGPLLGGPDGQVKSTVTKMRCGSECGDAMNRRERTLLGKLLSQDKEISQPPTLKSRCSTTKKLKSVTN